MLRDLYRELRRHFGYAPQWWPGEPLEIAISAILVQQCDWSAAWNAVSALRSAGLMDLQRMAEADPEDVLTAIGSVSFAPTKSRRLVANARVITAQGFQSIEEYLESKPTNRLRADLLKLAGIGQETADCYLLFAADRHEAFVVDAITHRVFSRLGLMARLAFPAWPRCYHPLRQWFLDNVLDHMHLYDEFHFEPSAPRTIALLRDLHAQIVELGKHHCLKNRPRCHDPGANGWTDYFYCEQHCLPSACGKCPLVRCCPSATATPPRCINTVA